MSDSIVTINVFDELGNNINDKVNIGFRSAKEFIDNGYVGCAEWFVEKPLFFEEPLNQFNNEKRILVSPKFRLRLDREYEALSISFEDVTGHSLHHSAEQIKWYRPANIKN